MQWTDIEDITEALLVVHPEADPRTVSFTELYRRIIALPGFEGDPKRCNERILEAVQTAWIEEYQ